MEDRARPWLDPLIASVLTVIGVAITFGDGAGGTVVDSLVVPAVTLPVAWRRSTPLAAAAAVSVGVVLSGIPSFDQTRCAVAIPAALLILFSLAARRERNEAVAGLAMVLPAMVLLLFTDPQLDVGAVFILPLCAGVWGAGRLARSRRRMAEELDARSRQLERTREDTAAMAVDVERTRLASDLDVAARERLRAIVELAGTEEGSQEHDTQRTREAFARIEREGRESLNEMRALLGVLRSHDHDTSPRPTLAQLESLLERARAGGTPVELAVDGEQRPLPSGVELAAYRMVQHSLEALGGPEGTRAEVQLRYLDDAIELEVRGKSAEGTASKAAVAAARERVTAQGGTFTAKAEGAGLALRARLPAVAAGG